MTQLIRSSTLGGYLGLVESLGGNADALLGAHQLDRAMVVREDAFIPLHSFVQLLESTARELQCPDFGLRLGGSQDMRILGSIALAMQHAANLREALNCASRFLFTVSPGIQFTLFERSPILPSLAEMRYEVILPNVPSRRQALDVGLSVAHGIARMLVADQYRVEKVHIPHAPSASVAAYKKYFAAPVLQEQSTASIFLKADCLDTPISAKNELIQRLVIDYLDVEYPQPGQSFSARIRQAIKRSIDTGQASKESIAQMMAMHPRTLQRRLDEEQTSFDVLRDEVRRDLVLHYLCTSGVSLAQLAGLVGFAEQSVLSRACQRWFRESPSQIRRRAYREGLLSKQDGRRSAAR